MEHFEREAYLQWLIPGSILLIGLLSALIGVCATHAVTAARVDSCLDAGGSFDYERGECDMEASHPKRPQAGYAAEARPAGATRSTSSSRSSREVRR